MVAVVSNGLRRVLPTPWGEAGLGGRLALLGPVDSVCVNTLHPSSGM